MQECSICLAGKLIIDIVVLDCTHEFCKDCIALWCMSNGSCPLCRAPAMPDCALEKFEDGSWMHHTNAISVASGFLARSDCGGAIMCADAVETLEKALDRDENISQAVVDLVLKAMRMYPDNIRIQTRAVTIVAFLALPQSKGTAELLDAWKRFPQLARGNRTMLELAIQNSCLALRLHEKKDTNVLEWCKLITACLAIEPIREVIAETSVLEIGDLFGVLTCMYQEHPDIFKDISELWGVNLEATVVAAKLKVEARPALPRRLD